ncbi:type II secretion system F family protein [Candidatus Woesearchaeota archaeon]|nr:type II secretion system F family protein [Candidatus Woesearchaeota archaeon]
MNSIKLILEKILDLIKEVEVYEFYKEDLIEKLETINKRYLRAEIDFDEYESFLRGLLGNKSKQELIRYYNSYIFYLLKKIEFYNSQVFYIAYHDELYKNLKLPEEVENQLRHLQKVQEDSKVSALSVKGKHLEKQKLAELKKDFSEVKKQNTDLFFSVKKKILDVILFRDGNERKLKLSLKTQKIEQQLDSERKSLQNSVYDEDFEKKLESELDKKTLAKESKSFKNSSKLVNGQADIAKRSFDSVYDRMKDDFERLVPKPMELDQLPDIPSPTTHSVIKYVQSLAENFKIKIGLKKESSELADEFKKLGLPTKGELDSIVSNVSVREGRIKKAKQSDDGVLKEDDFMSSETHIGDSLISLASKKGKEKKSSEVTDTNLMKEAHHMRLLLESQEKERQKEEDFWVKYNFVDRFLNIYVKKFSLYFIDSFPGLFKNLYEYMRFADIKMLSNTYVNIMIFMTFCVAVVAFPLSLIFNIGTGIIFFKAILNAIFTSLFLGVLTFLVVYNYPSFKIKSRRRSINSNLPFAINHMSAVAASGVPPNTMFKLIAMSDEYGEVSKEVRKIADYVALFGYDILTAIKQVSSTTPARSLKEFFDGFVATVEAGGNLVDYLKQKSDETMLSYNLERQKYNETISTYSDIYTGIMVAAPLFFMSTLSIVNLLGGKVGDLDVNSLLAYAIYLFLPLINVGFLIFVHFNQPEV